MSSGEPGTSEPSQASYEGSLPETLRRRTGFLLSAMGTLSRGELSRALEPLGIKPRGYGVLVVLAEEGPAPQRTVGARLGIDKSTMVVVVDELEGPGLVERRRNPQNRRAYELTLTDAGHETLSEAESVVEGVEEAVLAPLNEEERRRLHELLSCLLPDLGGRGQGQE